MKNNSRTFDVQIPFPAWDGIGKVADVCNELKRHKPFLRIPVSRSPRRITMDRISDLEVRVSYWYTGGVYATGIMSGADSHYGTSWELVSLKVKYRDYILQYLDGIDQVRIELGATELEAISLAAYRRVNVFDEIYGESHRKAIEEEATALAVVLDGIAAQVGA